MGADDPSVSFASTRLGQGANTALPIWAKFYKKATSLPKYKSASFFTETDSMLIKKFDCNFQDAALPTGDSNQDPDLPPDDSMPAYNDKKGDDY